VLTGTAPNLTYTPNAGYRGSDNFSFTVSNGFSTSNSAIVSITVGQPTITVLPASLPAGTVGSAYSQSVAASGGTDPYVYSVTAGSLPAGLTFASTGVLSGTPTGSGSYNFTITATDSSDSVAGPYSGARSYTLTVAAPTIAVIPAVLAEATRNVAYSQSLSASGGTAPYSFAITAGALPAGLTLAPNGTLSGSPSAIGSFSFTATATDTSWRRSL
jgi:hypothetical protein